MEEELYLHSCFLCYAVREKRAEQKKGAEGRENFWGEGLNGKADVWGKAVVQEGELTMPVHAQIWCDVQSLPISLVLYKV